MIMIFTIGLIILILDQIPVVREIMYSALAVGFVIFFIFFVVQYNEAARYYEKQRIEQMNR